MVTSFCKEYDEIVMYIIRSGSYKEPEIKLSFAPAILKPQNLYCKKKKELWNKIRNRMIDDGILIIQEFDGAIPVNVGLHPETIIEEYPDLREQCHWIANYFHSSSYHGNTNTCMNKIIEHFRTYNGPYVPPCLRIPYPTSSSAPSVQPLGECKEYVDLISCVVKTALLFTDPQKITEKEVLQTINLDGRMWKQVLVERSLQRMVKDNVLIPVCKQKERRVYKLCTFLEAKRFYRRGNADWLTDNNIHRSWIQLREFLNANVESFTQAQLIELFGPEAGTRYDALQADFQAKVKTEILDDGDAPQVPSSIDSSRSYQPTTDIRKGATRERAWTVSSNESESPRPRPVTIKAEPMLPASPMFNQAPSNDEQPPTDPPQLGKRKEHPANRSPSHKHIRLSTEPNSTDSDAMARARKYFADNYNATYDTVVPEAVSNTIPDLAEQLELLQHDSRDTGSRTIPDLTAKLEWLQHSSTGPVDRQKKLPKSNRAPELRSPAPDSESNIMPGSNPVKAPSIGDLRGPLEIPRPTNSVNPTSQPGLYSVQPPQLPGHTVQGFRPYGNFSLPPSLIPPTHPPRVISGPSRTPNQNLQSYQGNSYPPFNNVGHQYQPGPAGGVPGGNPRYNQQLLPGETPAPPNPYSANANTINQYYLSQYSPHPALNPPPTNPVQTWPDPTETPLILHTSTLAFPPPTDLQAIKAWFASPIQSGLKLWHESRIEHHSSWKALIPLLEAATGLSHPCITKHMMIACDLVLDKNQTKTPVTKKQKCEIGFRAMEMVVEEMNTPWKGDGNARTWVTVALQCYATWVVSQWKIGVHRKAQAVKARRGELPVVFGFEWGERTVGSVSGSAGGIGSSETAAPGQRQMTDLSWLKPVEEEEEISTKGRTTRKSKKPSTKTSTGASEAGNEKIRKEMVKAEKGRVVFKADMDADVDADANAEGKKKRKGKGRQEIIVIDSD
ncbi:hypothetical protein DL95DRAFT_463136 [Leptodontidium sp. 2 PMI_412]|nr:hypothetical protein DL95DRAFT_463136 [Leptodontidium sp. 2 PMI_412]